jgi:hypothetical protein
LVLRGVWGACPPWRIVVRYIENVKDWLTADPDDPGDERTAFSTLLRCSHEQAARCELARPEGITDTFFKIVSTGVAGAMVALLMPGVGNTAVAAGLALFTAAFPLLFLYIHYELSPVCIFRTVPTLPVCLADDLMDAWDSVFSDHVQWGALVEQGARGDYNGLSVVRASAVEDCTSAGVDMHDGGRVLSFWLSDTFPGMAARLFDGLPGGSALESVYDRYAFDGHLHSFDEEESRTDLHRACARLLLPNAAVPLIKTSTINLAILFLLQAAFQCIINLFFAAASAVTVVA